MLEISQGQDELGLSQSSETLKVEKITKFIKERVNEFRCEMQQKVDKINDMITSLEYEKSNMIIHLNQLRTKAEMLEKSKRQNSIIKRENRLVRAIRILRENSYLWQEIEKDDVIELRNLFGELRGSIEKSDIVKAEQEIFNIKKKYNFFRKLKDIGNVKYEHIEASIKANEKEIELSNKEIEEYESKVGDRIKEIEDINQVKCSLEELVADYKERVMESLERDNTDKALDLIDILNETNKMYKAIYIDESMLN